MKFFAAFVFVAALTAGHCAPAKNAGVPTLQQIKDLTEAALLYLQSNVPKYHNISLPDTLNQRLTVSDINTDVIASMRNGVVYGVNEVSFDQYELDNSTLSTKFRLTAPKIAEEYDYQVEGEMLGLKVSGQGVARIEGIGYGYVVSDLRFEEIDGSLQISVLELSLVIDNVRINIEGLNVEKITVQQLEKILEIYVVAKARQAIVEQRKGYETEMKKNINQLLSGHSTDQVIQWLKEHSNEGVHKDFIQNFVTSFVKVL